MSPPETKARLPLEMSPLEMSPGQVPGRPPDPPPVPAAGRQRILALDLARGLALLAMAVYHATWDLRYFGLIAVDPAEDPGWVAFARAIASTFLFLVGVGLVLAHRGGFRAGPYLRRLALIAGAAAVVSLATWLLFPDDFVRFGILHAIAVASVLALPFLRLPVPIVLLAAVAAFVAPVWLASPAFDRTGLYWTGLATDPPPSVDFVPILPWFSATLLGVAVARIVLAAGIPARLAAWRPRLRLGRAFVLAGQWSLLVYLVHQPILLAAIYPIAQLAGPAGTVAAAETRNPAETDDPLLAPAIADYRQACRAGCTAQGPSETVCTAYCGCVLDHMEATGLTRRILTAPELTTALSDRLKTFGEVCWRTVVPPPTL